MEGYFTFSRSGASLLDGLESYPKHMLGGVLTSSAEMQSAYSTTPANWAVDLLDLYTNQLIIIGITCIII